MTASTYSPTFLPSPYGQPGQPGQQWQQGHEQISATVHLVAQLLNSAQQQLFTAQQIIAQLATQQQPYQGWGQQPYQQYGQQFGQQQPYQQFGQQQPYQQFWQQQQRPYAMSW